jgi:hypothetical protein
MAPQTTDPEWYSIAELASKEMDPAKLTILVAQLCSALDESMDRRRPVAATFSPLPRMLGLEPKAL